MGIFKDTFIEFLKKNKVKRIDIGDKSISLEQGEWWGYSIPSKSGGGWMKMEGLGWYFDDAIEFLEKKD